ncbi:MAG: oligosaccharyl transferase, archaeosortase A system-associated [Candidatus Methanoperedens sp.]|nr:oligosaccharyl transferase, archaeosortase A system-associated [Candidatus Methanoperedens sp.]
MRRKKNLKDREPSDNAVVDENVNKKTCAFLFLIFLLALIFRLMAFDKIFSDGRIIFQGYDEYYHARLIAYSVQNFPDFLWFDSYVDYPNGINVGWMPLYDLVNAFIALLIGFGSPSLYTIEAVAAVFPVLLGALTVLPIFFIGRELMDKKLGLLGAFMFAIMPAHILVSRLGAVDHHVAEVLLFSLILLLIIVSLKRGRNAGQSEKNIFAVLAGISIGILVFTWSAAPIYIAIFGLYFIIQYGANLYGRTASNNLVIIGAIASCSAFIISVVLYLFYRLPLYQIAGVAALFTSVILGGVVSDAMLKKNTHWLLYPVAVVSLVVLIYGAIMSSSTLGGLFQGLMQFLERENIVSTIAEAQPFAPDFFSFFISLYFSSSFGSALVFAFFGIFLFFVYELRSRFTPEKLLLAVTAVAVSFLAFQQVRFSYLLSIFVAVFSAYFIYRGFFYRKVFNYNTAVGIILSVMIIALTAYQGYTTSAEAPAIMDDWQESLLWMQNNTPATSYYDDPKEKPEYSVMAMWDYGNWIEYRARRPVVANNFQAGASTADEYLAADTEQAANGILDGRKTRYVILDSDTGFGYKDFVHGKFGSVLKVAGKNESDYYYSFEVPTPDYTASADLLNDNYYNTVYARLFLLDGSSVENPLKSDAKALSRYRLVYESNTTWLNKTGLKKIKIFEYVPGAKIKGKAQPGARLNISVPVSTNRNRTFNYINRIEADARGNFTLVVPYATEGTPYGTGPDGNYTLSVNGLPARSIRVSNQQVMRGDSIDTGYVGGESGDKRYNRTVRPAPQKMNITWSYEIGEQIFNLAVRNNLIYATSDKKIYAIDTDNRSLAWKKEFPNKLASSELIGDKLYAATRQGLSARIYSIDTNDGSITEISFQGDPSGFVPALPVQADGSMLFVGTTKIMNAVDLSSRAIKWRFTADEPIISRPVIAGNKLIAVSYNGTVYALDKTDGTLRWKKTWDDDIWSAPMAAGDTIYFGDRSGAVNALDAATGEQRWKYETGYFVDASPVLADNTIYAASYDGKVYALNASTGERIWKSEQLYPVYAQPAVKGDSVFTGTLNGSLFRLNRSDGRVEGICATNGTIRASPILLGGAVYVGTQEGILYACG